MIKEKPKIKKQPTLIELKAMAWDLGAQIKLLHQRLEEVNVEILNRSRKK